MGAALAMRERTRDGADSRARDIDYVNLHGTGTRTNDVAEDAAIRAVLGDDVPRSSTKGWTGHTLGAAGLVEAVITAMAIREGFVPGTLELRDTSIRRFAATSSSKDATRAVAHAMSNSFGFGGSNCALVFGSVA